uniref:SAGA-associated factor 11 n=1 Tax=Syphacia muris TaxID=451379 RepID=A0A0N5AZQ6_9BILA
MVRHFVRYVVREVTGQLISLSISCCRIGLSVGKFNSYAEFVVEKLCCEGSGSLMDETITVPDDVQVTPDNVNDIAENFYQYIFDAVLLYPVFSIHRIAKLTGTDVLLRPIKESTSTENDVDIFGTPRSFLKQPKNMEVYCDECNRSIAASRFAPHLEKCMGMGRNSSRIARRKLANYVSLKGSSSTGRLRDSVGRESDIDHSDIKSLKSS